MINMYIIGNYLGTNLFKGLIIIIFLLLSIDIFFYFVNELKIVGIGNYTLIKAILFVLLTIPRKIYTIAPWAVLLGCLLVLGNMNKYNELVFLRLIGLSIHKIALLVSFYVGIFIVGIFVLGELLAPKIELLAQNKKTLALSKGNAIYTTTGTWIRNKDKFIHVAAIRDHKMLQELVIYELDDKFELQRMKFAQTAQVIDDGHRVESQSGDTGNLWELSDVIITDFSKLPVNHNNDLWLDNILKPSSIKLAKVAKLQEVDLLDLNILHTSNIKHLERLSIANLAKIIKNRKDNNLTVIDYQIAYWKKIFHPVTILIMGYLATPFVFGPLRACSKGTYLLIGVLIGISFYLINAFLVPLVTVIGVPAWLAAILSPIIFFAIGLYLAVRIN